MGKKQHRPITSAAADRAVLALERLIEAPDFDTVFSSNNDAYFVEGAWEVLLRIWSDLKDEGK